MRDRLPKQHTRRLAMLVLTAATLRLTHAAVCTTYTPTGGGGIPDGCFFQLRSRCEGMPHTRCIYTVQHPTRSLCCTTLSAGTAMLLNGCV